MHGYRGKALEILYRFNTYAGEHVIIELDSKRYEGIIMPRYESADDTHIVLKLRNGYNIGISIDRIKSIKSIEGKNQIKIAEVEREDRGLSKIAMISTGGTIASKIDYRTGGVRAMLTAKELYDAIPELGELADIYPEVLFSEYSENLTFKHWSMLAEKIYEKSKEGYKGIVVTHGTDTMHYTAAALSFAVSINKPIVLVGAQRSSDRPSSDAATNLIAATTFASKSDLNGVFVAMHDSISDDTIAIHLGTRVRKNHTSRRNAFKSIGIKPIAYVRNGEIIYNLRVETRREEYILPKFEDKVALLKYHPNMDARLIEYLSELGYKGLVLEGTGLGHVSKHLFNSIEDAIKKGMIICMTSQCIYGRVRMTVYETGRDLLRRGVLPLDDMLPEVALVKLSWALANKEDVKSVMLKNIAMEMSDRSLVD